MTKFLLGTLILLLSLSACISPPLVEKNPEVIKAVPLATTTHQAKAVNVSEAQANVTRLQKQLDALWDSPAFNMNGKSVGKSVREQLSGTCQGNSESYYHKEYCPEILDIQTQIQPYQGIINTQATELALRGTTGVEQTPSRRSISSTRTIVVVPVANNETIEVGGGPVNYAQAQLPTTQPGQHCEGIPQQVAPRVIEFLTCDVIKILSLPDRVESYRVKSKPDISVELGNRLGRFPIVREGLNLKYPKLEKLQKLLFAKNSYVFQSEKRCRFRPGIGLHFIKGNEAVEILFDVPCRLWLFVYKQEEKLEDFDRIVDQLTFLNSLLPPLVPTPTPPLQVDMQTPPPVEVPADTEGQYQPPIGTVGTIVGPGDGQ